MDEFIFDYLKGNKKNLNAIGHEAINSLNSLSKKYQLIGFISSIYKFSSDDKLEDLQFIRRISVAKNLIMTNDLHEICKKFNSKKINYCVLKGPALVHAKIYKSGVRFFRDLDILVSKKDLNLAHKTLNQIGFHYENKFANNSCDVLGNMHHLPIMINDNGTYLELHHRATIAKNYLNCPISDKILKDKIFYNGMYIPSPEALIGHALYHGLVHHDDIIGPITLFDLKEISKKFNLHFDANNEYVEALGLDRELKKIKNLFISIEKESYTHRFREKLDHINQNIVFKHSSENKIDTFNLKKIIKKLGNNFFYNKVELTEFKYQIKRTNFKFIFFYVLELLGSIKRKIKFF
tara:strand:- start:1942 stop:2991 length:1050 start_codon:yes stop_codon:yes gene_type:complete